MEWIIFRNFNFTEFRPVVFHGAAQSCPFSLSGVANDPFELLTRLTSEFCATLCFAETCAQTATPGPEFKYIVHGSTRWRSDNLNFALTARPSNQDLSRSRPHCEE